jgi:hypothetical protein
LKSLFKKNDVSIKNKNTYISESKSLLEQCIVQPFNFLFMTNDAKSLLMQYLGRISEHYEIPDFRDFTFKRRTELLDRLKEKNAEAYVVMEDLFSAFVKQDRIRNDKEKFDKARVLWEAEHAAAEKEKVHAEMHLVDFCKKNAIAIGSLSLTD